MADGGSLFFLSRCLWAALVFTCSKSTSPTAYWALFLTGCFAVSYFSLSGLARVANVPSICRSNRPSCHISGIFASSPLSHSLPQIVPYNYRKRDNRNPCTSSLLASFRNDHTLALPC